MLDAPLDWSYGRNDYDLVIDDEPRNFVVHVPELYQGDEAVPLVFMLHGTGGTGDRFYRISGWVGQAGREGFIAIFPTALEYPIVESGLWQTKWSAGGLEEVIPDGYPIKDDVPFLRELISLCRRTFLIEERRSTSADFPMAAGS